jgi:hypothetical protein
VPTRRLRNLLVLPNPKRLRRHIPLNLSSITPRIVLKSINATAHRIDITTALPEALRTGTEEAEKEAR